MVQSQGPDGLFLQPYDPIYPCTPDPEGNPPDPADAEIGGYSSIAATTISTEDLQPSPARIVGEWS